MKKENKKLLSIFVVVIIVSAAVATALTFGMKYLEEGEKEEQTMFVKIFADEIEGFAPFSVNFTSIAQNYEGDLEYSWDFGDEETSEQIKPSHNYEETGEYTCKLVITDSRGKKITDSIKLSVKRNKPPIVTISINQNTLERKFIPILSILPLWPGDVQKIVNTLEERDPNIFGEGTIVCNAQVDDPEDDEIVSYRWTHIAETQLSQFGKPEQPIHYFDANKSIRLPEIYTWPRGRHVVTLTVEDSAGNTANATIEFQVEQSLKMIQREQKQRLVKKAFDQWLLYGKPFFGIAIAGLLLTMWKYNNFTGTKLVTLSVLTFLLQLDMGDALLIQTKEFLDEHPRILKAVNNSLVRLQDRLDKNRNRLPSDFVNNTIDSIEVLRESLGLSNKRPVISNPFPQNGEVFVDLNTQKVFITVTDPEGEPFDVIISGDYVNTKTYTNEHDGSFNATLNTPLPANTEITWNIIVTDEYDKEVTGEYTFTTRYE